MTITATEAAMTTPTMATMTSRPWGGDVGAAEEYAGAPPRPEDEAAAGRPEGGPTSPSAEARDRPVVAVAPEEEAEPEEESPCSREDEEGYVVLGVAAVEM